MQVGDLEAMHQALLAVLEALARLADDGHVARRAEPSAPQWDGEAALQVLWRLLVQLKSAGCRVFPFAGTLLGLERDGRLLRATRTRTWASGWRTSAWPLRCCTSGGTSPRRTYPHSTTWPAWWMRAPA